ncbi:MAG: sle [Acidimicrobiales bacterium]|nr:sle [Acidimicrobiales bacterium]
MLGTSFGHDLRTIRERRGWARETLAFHAGISVAAIAQIEAGRRPDPRLSTVIALAQALDVSVDRLTGRSLPLSGGPHPLQHRALLYATDDEFVEASMPFLTDGLERSDAVMVVTDRSRIKRLRRALAGDAQRVEFRESSSWYATPQGAMEGYRAFVDERVSTGSAWVRIIGEPVWAGRSAREARAWARYEALLNISFAASPATIMCPYGTQSLPPSIVAEARCTHPEVTSGTTSDASPTYRQPEAFLLDR